ncbi:hypothetical protein P7C71_g2947, partial [Lecanoromycetidae sp. Uapishka_2]
MPLDYNRSSIWHGAYCISLLLHATHFSKPAEQVKILRIIILPPVFALVYFFAGAFLDAAIYLQPWADFYEAIALASYFLLLVQLLVPVPERRDAFFDQLERKNGGSSLKWYRRTWIFVFQYIVFQFIVAVVTDATQAVGVYCANGSGLHFAHIWLTVIHSVSVALAFIRLLRFYSRCKTELKQYGVLRKLVAIKGVVFLTTLQQIVFTILNSTGAVKPSAKLSYNDIYYGIPSIIVCGEMGFAALFQLYAYNARPYFLTSSISSTESHMKPANLRYHGGFLGIKAFAAALDPRKILGGIGQMLRYIVSNPPVQQNYSSAMSMEPIRPSRGMRDQPPAYMPAQDAYRGATSSQREYSPYADEYRTADQYTPLARPQY